MFLIALEKLFEELTRCKEDDQQRNWMLYEDEGRISQLLTHVCDRLQNAPNSASLHVLKRFKYFYVTSLIEYFQMEVRWSIRRLLIEAFLLMCYMDANIIEIMLSSVLPLELVQDIYQTSQIKKDHVSINIESFSLYFMKRKFFPHFALLLFFYYYLYNSGS